MLLHAYLTLEGVHVLLIQTDSLERETGGVIQLFRGCCSCRQGSALENFSCVSPGEFKSPLTTSPVKWEERNEASFPTPPFFFCETDTNPHLFFKISDRYELKYKWLVLPLSQAITIRLSFSSGPPASESYGYYRYCTSLPCKHTDCVFSKTRIH